MAVVPCNHASLIFEYKPDQNKQMSAYLTINKNNHSILFKYPTHTYQVKVDGQLITKVIQSGLGVFFHTIIGYLTAIGADKHLDKLPEYSRGPKENQQSSDTVENNGYQQGNYNSHISI